MTLRKPPSGCGCPGRRAMLVPSNLGGQRLQLVLAQESTSKHGVITPISHGSDRTPIVVADEAFVFQGMPE